MTEAEWLACADPKKMLEYLRGKASDRKLRLFTSACCRHIERLLQDEDSRRVMESIELQADELVTSEQVIEAAEEVNEDWADRLRWAAESAWHQAFDGAKAMATEAAATAFLGERVRAFRTEESPRQRVWEIAEAEEKQYQVAILRDVMGNPFRPISVDSTWLTWQGGLAVSMARRMYDSRDFADMPVLADALEDAGCTNQDILRHCREPGEHVRGCWVVDVMLGKS